MIRRKRSALHVISWTVLPVSLFLYVSSLTMNVAIVEKHIGIAGFGKTSEDPVKLLSTIRTLYQTGDIFLAVIITAFTILFPIGKYVALFYVLATETGPRRSRVTGWIKNFGQWSMGDVFVVALLVVILRINSSIAQVRVDVEPGLYFFAASVLTGMFVSVLVAMDKSKPEPLPDRGEDL
jgi:paraquat-inducible protein A